MAGCAAPPPTLPPPTLFPVNVTPDANLGLTLSLPQATFATFDEITATVVLKNVGTEQPLINRKMPLRADPGQSALALQILPANGVPLRFTADVNSLPMIMPYDFFRLLPGRAFTRTTHLSLYGDTPQTSGAYTVQARYHNAMKYERLPVWEGELYSNIVQFTVAP